MRVDLGWGSRPGSTSIIPPLWKVGQREGDLLGRARRASLGHNRGDGGVVVGIDGKVVVTHILSCVPVKGESAEV